MATLGKITPCLWFDDRIEAAAKFYAQVFKGKITNTDHYPETGKEQHGHKAGDVLTVELEIMNTPFMLLNGGSQFKFSEAVSFVVHCENQAEVDYYWNQLREGGDPKAQECGWLKDQFGVSWQIVPIVLPQLLLSQDKAKRERVFAAMLKMKKLEVAALEKAAAG